MRIGSRIKGGNMFLKPNVLNSLMKQAYKTGLVVARTTDNWIYLAGSYWETSIKYEFIDKKTMGNIISLIGELPEPGTRYKCTKDGNQIEIEMPLSVNEKEFAQSHTIEPTKLLLIGNSGVVQRILQDETTGKIYIVNNVFIGIVGNDCCMEDKGEYSVMLPYYHPVYGILWKNNVCKFRAHFRVDDGNEKIIKNLDGVDITSNIFDE